MNEPLVGPRFFVHDSLGGLTSLTIGEDAARHMRVLRLGVGAAVVLMDGQGARAAGTLRSLSKRNAAVDIQNVYTSAPLPDLHALVPIADRDRMLWLAEKSAELGLSSWRPVMWKRSRSVSPKGEGSGFQQKIRARMASALEQSGNAWLPSIYPDATLDRALAAIPEGGRAVMHATGTPLAQTNAARSPMTLAIGPEGGFDDQELALLDEAGFVRASLGASTLRFETAGTIAIGIARAMLTTTETEA